MIKKEFSNRVSHLPVEGLILFDVALQWSDEPILAHILRIETLQNKEFCFHLFVASQLARVALLLNPKYNMRFSAT